MNNKKALVGAFLGGLLCLYHPIAGATESGEFEKAKRGKLTLGIGTALVRFDTNFKFTDKESGISIFVDAEGTLDLDEIDTVPVLYGYYRLAKRHGIGFSYFRIKREAEVLQFNEDTDLNLGDLELTAGANAEVTLEDRSSFYFLSYNFTVLEDYRSFVFASFGMYGLDLKYTLSAEGEFTLDDQPVASDSLVEEASVFAPLPLIGIDAWFFLRPKWSVGTKVSVIGGTYQDISATVLDSRIRARYRVGRNVGFTFGVTYFNADIEIDEEDLVTDVGYGFDGLSLGVDLNF